MCDAKAESMWGSQASEGPATGYWAWAWAVSLEPQLELRAARCDCICRTRICAIIISYVRTVLNFASRRKNQRAKEPKTMSESETGDTRREEDEEEDEAGSDCEDCVHPRRVSGVSKPHTPSQCAAYAPFPSLPFPISRFGFCRRRLRIA